MRNLIHKFLNKKTVGVRVLLINNNKILLVRHTYISGWYTIGGGVDEGESPLQAIARELGEEVHINCDSFELFGFYYSNKQRRDDYVALYVAQVNSTEFEIDNKEIAQANWFSFDDLPSDISPATKRRIEEYLGRTTKTDLW